MDKFIKEHTIVRGFVNAFSGLLWAFHSQINFKIHLLALILVMITGFMVKLNYYEWLILISVVTGILTLELVNTSLEQTTDAVTEKYNITIKRAKDTAAAAVLIYAFYAIIIAIMIFGPKFSLYFSSL